MSPRSAALDELLGHREIARVAAGLRERPGELVDASPDSRRAAVALVLRATRQSALEVLMIQRAELERDPWSGQVALPGGRHEPSDADLAATAMRETLEETGVDLARSGRILGTLDEIHPRTPVLPPIVVRPYVAVVLPDVEILPSPEVAQAFWVPVEELRQPARWIETPIRIHGEDRVVVSFRHGDYTVWGMTERVLRQFLRLL